MKPTKYQLLKADFDFACRQRQHREMIELLRKEKKQAYHDGINKVGSTK